MAPEYAIHGSVSPKIDIFSFGVLVLEIITRRRNCSSDYGDTVNLISDVSAGFTLFSSVFSAFEHGIIYIIVSKCIIHVNHLIGVELLDKRNNSTNDGWITRWIPSEPSATVHPHRAVVRPNRPWRQASNINRHFHVNKGHHGASATSTASILLWDRITISSFSTIWAMPVHAFPVWCSTGRWRILEWGYDYWAIS